MSAAGTRQAPPFTTEIPAEMKSYRSWVVWQYELRAGEGEGDGS